MLRVVPLAEKIRSTTRAGEAMLAGMDADVLEFLAGPTEFLTVAANRLAEQPVVSTVVATIAQRAAGEVAEGIAQETARLTGGSVAVAQHTRLFELGELVEPAPVEGSLRPAVQGDLELAVECFSLFRSDADEQAGRPRGRARTRLPAPTTYSDASTRGVSGSGSTRRGSGCT
jgi:hypothetical protein